MQSALACVQVLTYSSATAHTAGHDFGRVQLGLAPIGSDPLGSARNGPNRLGSVRIQVHRRGISQSCFTQSCFCVHRAQAMASRLFCSPAFGGTGKCGEAKKRPLPRATSCCWRRPRRLSRGSRYSRGKGYVYGTTYKVGVLELYDQTNYQRWW